MIFLKEETCCRCKMRFAMPQAFYETALQMREKMSFCCPAGHSQNYITGETEETKLRRQLERKTQNEAYLESRIKEEKEAKEALERSNNAQRGVVTRMKNRSAHGVCMCCNRTFTNLAKHMQSKHPEYKKEDVA